MKAEERLRWYFCEGESALGARSSFGAMVAVALAGANRGGGGTTNGVEQAAVEDRRLDAARMYRRIRDELAALTAESLQVLAAAYGPHDWRRHADRALRDQGTGIRLERAFGPLVGVAMLTREAVAGRARVERSHRLAEHGPGGWLVAIVLGRDDAAIHRVRLAAARMLAAALVDYAPREDTPTWLRDILRSPLAAAPRAQRPQARVLPEITGMPMPEVAR